MTSLGLIYASEQCNVFYIVCTTIFRLGLMLCVVHVTSLMLYSVDCNLDIFNKLWKKNMFVMYLNNN